MKKFYFALTLFFGLYFHSQAQFMVGGHLGPAFPLGRFSDIVNLGFGLGAEGKYLLNENLALGFNISWYSFGTGVDEVNQNITPFLLSAEYIIPQSTGLTPYFGLGIGVYRIATRFSNFSASYSDFGIAPTVGALYPLSDQLDLNANLKFNFVFSEGETSIFIPLNVGVLVKIP